MRLLVPYSLPSAFSVYSLLARISSHGATPGNILQEKAPGNITLPPIYEPSPGNAADTPAPSASVSPIDLWMLTWLIGTAACFVFFAVSYLRCLRSFRESLPVDNERVKQWLAEHSLFRKIDVRQSDRIPTPLTYGVFRPVILLPKKAARDESDDLKYVLSHEYVHIRRFDAVFKLLLTTALCVHWFNPAVWIMYFIANRDIEIFCDEAVVRMFGEQKKSDYALALIRMEEQKSGSAPLVPHFNKSAIEERIMTIMKFKKTTASAIIAAVILTLGTTVAFATSAKSQSGDPEPPTSTVGEPSYNSEPTDDPTISDDNASAPSTTSDSSGDDPSIGADTPSLPTEENKSLSAEEWSEKPLVLPSKFAPEDLDFVNTTNGFSGNRNITIQADRGSDVYAVDDGEVAFAVYDNMWNSGSGNCVVIKHGENMYTIYSHLLPAEESGDALVSTGDQVKAGQCIGFAGNSGYALSNGISYGFYTELSGFFKDKVEEVTE